MKTTDFTTVPRIPWNQIADAKGQPIPVGANLFGDALRLSGFAILTDAPFRSDLLKRNYSLMKEVFGLGVDILSQKYMHPEIGFQRGYMPTCTEIGIRCNNEPDEKEVMAFGSYHNVKMLDVAGYTETVEEYYSACQDIGYTLMHVLSIYLDPDGLERDYLLGLFRNAGGSKIDDSHMRHIRYPGTAKRMACAHTDSNMLSLLPAAAGKGLEVKNNIGQWMAVQTEAGDLVVNAGDMLNMISGGKIRSTLHRVENKLTDRTQFRYSMPFFFHPDHEQDLKILDSCKNEPEERRMFMHDKITGYHLLFELLELYKVIPEGVTVDEWQASMEKLKRDGF
jgi:isopenicillin N synthase-like dioxygenase